VSDDRIEGIGRSSGDGEREASAERAAGTALGEDGVDPTDVADRLGSSVDAETEGGGEDGDEVDGETTSVLEFVLGAERYCLDISYVEQIVERGTVTRIPNAPAFVEGVIDLRGDITTVIDPTETLATGDDDGGDRIVVFDSDRMDDGWSVGWAVDGVRRVSTVSLDSVKESPIDEPWINGVIKRADDGEFVVWTEPGELMRVDDADR
jgi:purine-binding chemotaxis protein CheW